MASTDRRLRALIDELLETHEPAIRRAFIEAMQDARGAVDLAAVVDALARGDLTGAMQAIEVSRSFLAPLDHEMARAYYRAGRGVTGLLMASRPRGVSVEVRFDPGNPRAAQWLAQHSSSLVTEIVADQRVAVREALDAGMAAGRHPRTVALDVVGRVRKRAERDTLMLRDRTVVEHEWPRGSRTGLIGLRSDQIRTIERLRENLASGDPQRMREYLKLALRDRRFDARVATAIREGRAVAALDVARMAERYADRALLYRGEVIARTEMLAGFSVAQAEAIEQLIDSGKVRAEHISKVWSATMDRRTRDSHVALNGEKAPLREPFRSPLTGAALRFPRDPNAPASEVAQCRCQVEYRVSWADALRDR